MNHTPHLLAAIFLCGLWLPVWILTALTFTPQWHCAVCGYSDSQRYLANPQLRERENLAAQQRAAARASLKAQREADVEGLGFQERIAYEISAHKQAIVLGSIGAFMLAGGLAVSLYVEQHPPPLTAAGPTQAEETQVANRRALAMTLERELTPKLPSLIVSANGSAADSFTFRSKSITEAQHKVLLANAALMERMKSAGVNKFTVENGKDIWVHTP